VRRFVKNSVGSRALSDNVDTLRREYCEGQHVGDVGRRLGTLTVHQHALGGIPRAAREGQVDLYAPLTL